MTAESLLFEGDRAKARLVLVVKTILLVAIVPLLPFLAIWLIITSTLWFQGVGFEERVEIVDRRQPNGELLPHEKILGILDVSSADESVEGATSEAIPRWRDVDGDGAADTIVRDTIHLSRDGREYSFHGFSNNTASGFADVDSDGYLDAWICDPADATVRVLYGREDRFRGQQNLPIGADRAAFWDEDGDGQLELIVEMIRPKPVNFLYSVLKIERVED